MDASQPIITRRRTRAMDRALSRLVEPQAEAAKDAPATAKPHPSEESISTPRELSDRAEASSDALESLTSGSAMNGEDARRSHTAPQVPDEASAESIPSSQVIAGLTSTRQRYQYNTITYKRNRSMRTRSVSVSVSVPSTQPEAQAQEPSEIPSLVSTQPQLADDDYTPSPSPVPAHSSTRTRKRRRRRLAPLKNRLARVARSRLARVQSQEIHSQPPIAVLVPSEYGEEELDVEPEQPNATRRRLDLPENYTIPDLKDLINSSSKPTGQAATQIVHNATQQLPLTTQSPVRHNPTPRFVLPNAIHTPRTQFSSKSPRKPKKKDIPRLNFVAFETHQGQGTSRRGASVFGTRRLPLGVTQPSPTRNKAMTQVSEIEEISRPFENNSNSSPTRSSFRVLVKNTPEPEVLCVPKRLDFAGTSQSGRIHEPVPEDIPGIESPTEIAATQAKSGRPLAPMSELYDSLIKLARSADRMGTQILPDAPEPFNNSANLKRKLQTTLTPQLSFEIARPAKLSKLQ